VARTSSKYAVSPGLEEAELLAEESDELLELSDELLALSDELLELSESEQPSGPSSTASNSRRLTGCERRRTKR
jgi:hypothetical protein